MNVLLTNPPNRYSLEGDRERFFTGAGCRFPFSIAKTRETAPRYAPFPFFLAYAAGVLERDGFAVKVIDAVPINLNSHDFVEWAVAVQPAVLFMEPATVAIDHALALCREIKEKTGCLLVLGGSHVTAMPREVLQQHAFVDYVLIGEYEMTLATLLKGLRTENSFNGQTGVACRTSAGEIVVGERASLIEPLDQLPFPARHLFPSYFNNNIALYHDGFCQGRPAVQMHSSRGCPFRCNFCTWVQVIYGGGRRRGFSASRIVDEMELVVRKYHAREVYFDDDDFTADKEAVLNLCRELKARNVKINWSVMGDVMVTDEALLESMADAGCIGMKFGLESANRNVLKQTGKPVRPERIPALVRKALALGIKTHMTVTFGLLGETRSSLDETFAFARSVDVDSVQFSVATPYPGTPFYNELKRTGRINFTAWRDFDGYNSSVIRYADFSNQELHEFVRTANWRWLRHKLWQPRWALRQVRFLGWLLRNQGVAGFRKRLKRATDIVLESLPRKNVSPATVPLRR